MGIKIYKGIIHLEKLADTPTLVSLSLNALSVLYLILFLWKAKKNGELWLLTQTSHPSVPQSIICRNLLQVYHCLPFWSTHW